MFTSWSSRLAGCCFRRPAQDVKQYYRPATIVSGGLVRWEDTKPFVPPIAGGHCIKVCDGDTITVAARLPFPESPMYRFQVRLAGVDCPELKGSSEEEKRVAQLAQVEVSRLVLNHWVELEEVRIEKYGRLLAHVYCLDRNKGTRLHVNQHLLDEHLAVRYDGGTKMSPPSWWDFYVEKNGKIDAAWD